MNTSLALFALLTGVATGMFFGSLEVPIPAPPTLAGIMGIVGIFVGYRLVDMVGISFDVLGALGF